MLQNATLKSGLPDQPMSESHIHGDAVDSITIVNPAGR